MRTFHHGLILGKFYPFHAGHSALITQAEAQCQRVTVQLLANHQETIPIYVRHQWISEQHPQVNLVSAYDDHPVDFDDPIIWDLHMQVIENLLDSPVDAVFTSDNYGAELARRLNAQWVQVDPNRSVTPISATMIRSNPSDHWWALAPCVRAWYVKRIVIVGAESTGTTTLARALAGALKCSWVPEFGREWTLKRPGGMHRPWESKEFDFVAREQSRKEDALAREALVPWLIADTDALATAIWHERYIGYPAPHILQYALTRPPHLYVLTPDDIPFVQDGMRDGEHLRGWMTERFRQILTDQQTVWIEVGGTVRQRLQQVLSYLND